MGIPYEADRVRQHLIDAGVWPGGSEDEPGVTYARQWWVDLLKQVTYGVNDHPWGETEDMGDAIREITEIAVDQVVGAAYVHRSIMSLLHLSDVAELDVSDEVEMYLHTPIFADPTRGMYPHRGESYDDPDYRERKLQAQDKHNEEVNELLSLKSVTKTYLLAAALTVARPWCETQVARALVQWRCELCEETFAAEQDAENDDCDGRETCVTHPGEEHDGNPGCSWPHALVKNDTA